MSLTNASSKRRQASAAKQAAVRRKKVRDPIFRRRSYPYNEEEIAYICSLAPIGGVPHSLIPSSDNPSPPTLHRGWVLSETAIEGLLKEAGDRDLIQMNYKMVKPDDYDYENPNADENRVWQEDGIDDITSMEVVIQDIIEEMGLKFPARDFVTMFAVPKIYCAAGIVLYTNYDLDRRPTDEDMEKIRSRFGLSGPPRWYPDGNHFQWIR